jgi:hypothetical protein
MIIVPVKAFLERRAASAMSSPQIHQLEAAVTAAIASGDHEAAATLQREADRLRAQLVAQGATFVAPKPPPKAKNGEQPKQQPPKIVPAGVIALQWAALNPTKIQAINGVCVLDCGDRGAVTITPTGISCSGSLGNDPTAILLTARHAQLHWNGTCRISGTDSYKFQVAVAGQMLGVKTQRAHVPLMRRADATRLKVEWQPLLASITGSPTRPNRPGRSAEISSPTPAPRLKPHSHHVTRPSTCATMWSLEAGRHSARCRPGSG